MVARDDLERFRAANASLSDLVIADLQGFFYALNLSKPEAARDALLEFVPLLVQQYGPVAADLATDWYEDMRAASGAVGKFKVTPSPLVTPDDAVEASVRYSAGHLFTSDPMQTLATLGTAVDKLVRQPGRDTMAWNADREGVGYARVPKGAKTCAFCLVLASRDAVYGSAKSAGSRKHGKEFHGHCDCEIVRMGRGDEYPQGYIPKDLYDIYSIGADKAGTRSDIKAITYDLRRRFPDRFTDGVIDDDYLAQVG